MNRTFTLYISYLGVRVGNIDGSKRFDHSADQQVHWRGVIVANINSTQTQAE